MVAHKKKAIWGSGLIAFLSIMSTTVYLAKSHFVDHMCISEFLPESSAWNHFFVILDFSQIADFNSDHFDVFLDFFSHYLETESEKARKFIV